MMFERVITLEAFHQLLSDCLSAQVVVHDGETYVSWDACGQQIIARVLDPAKTSGARDKDRVDHDHE